MIVDVGISNLKMGEDALSKLEKRIASNADALIAEGKEAWLLRRKEESINAILESLTEAYKDGTLVRLDKQGSSSNFEEEVCV